jgi:hypothetical protein
LILQSPGLATSVWQLRQQFYPLGPVPVAQDGVSLLPGGVEMDAGQAQAALDRALDLTDALHLGRLPGSSWNFDGDPTGIVMVRR